MPIIMKKVLTALFAVLILLGSTELHGQFAVYNNATNLGGGCYRLTQNQTSQRGAIWRIGSFNMNESWDLQAEVRFGGNADGAEGIAFVLKTASSGFIGGSGGLMGFGGDFFTTAISPSVIIEMDTSQDEGLGDPAYHHIGIQKNGSNVHLGDDLIAAPVPAVPGNASITDNAYHSLRVTFDAGTLEMVVYFDNVQRISATVDVAEILGTNDVQWGFTAATGTGSGTNTHRVRNAELAYTEDDFEIVYGCTTSNACNYNSDATDDDGSCIPSGCMETEACNYNELAECEGEECVYSCCPGPACCGEGMFWDYELEQCQIFETCQEDLDGDGVIGINDLMQLLSSFGTMCEEPETAEFSCGDPMNYHGYDYATVQIGEQCWFAENCRHLAAVSPPSLGFEDDSLAHAYVHGYDGVSVDEAMTMENYALHGVLYNQLAAESWDICPTGWHVPIDANIPQQGDFEELKLALPANAIGTALKASPTDVPPWDGNNSSGFKGVSSGARSLYWDGEFSGLDITAFYWSQSGWSRRLDSNDENLSLMGLGPAWGLSVRCLKDTE